VDEMNVHMNLQYVIIKNRLTKSFDMIFHLIKKYGSKIAGVCWLKLVKKQFYVKKIQTIISIESAKTVELCKHENNTIKSQSEFEFNQTFD
jgi:hypothetical protein